MSPVLVKDNAVKHIISKRTVRTCALDYHISVFADCRPKQDDFAVLFIQPRSFGNISLHPVVPYEPDCPIAVFSADDLLRLSDHLR